MSTAASKRDQSNKARERAAKASKDVAAAQQKVHAAEVKLREAEAAEIKKATETRKRADAKAEQDRARAATAMQRSIRQRDEAHQRELAELRAQLVEHGEVLAAAPWDQAPETITVLLITASPEDQAPLRLDTSPMAWMRIRCSSCAHPAHDQRPATKRNAACRGTAWFQFAVVAAFQLRVAAFHPAVV